MPFVAIFIKSWVELRKILESFMLPVILLYGCDVLVMISCESENSWGIIRLGKILRR